MFSLLPLSLLSLTGCVTPLQAAGHVDLCLGTDGDASVALLDSSLHDRWEISGTLREPGDDVVFDVTTCNQAEPQHVIELEDADGQRWWVGLSAGEEGDWVEVGDLGVTVGEEATLTFLRELGWAADDAVVLRDAEGLVFAAEEGWGADLLAEDPDLLSGVTVEAGELYGPSERAECGTKRGLSLLVDDGAGEQEVLTGTWTSLSVDELPHVFMNIGAWAYEGQVECTDTWGPSPWLLYRGVFI